MSSLSLAMVFLLHQKITSHISITRVVDTVFRTLNEDKLVCSLMVSKYCILLGLDVKS